MYLCVCVCMYVFTYVRRCFIFNILLSPALNYDISLTNECTLVKYILLHIDNNHHVSVLFTTFTRMSQRILINIQ